MIKWYLDSWWEVMARPIYFYTKLKEENWQEKALTFELATSWLVGLAATIVIFIIQYIPIGSTLVEGISGFKFILILPVLLVLIFVFFLITFLISGGLFALAFLAFFLGLGYFLHYVYLILGGKGHLRRMLQNSLYSSAAVTSAALVMFFAVLTKWGILDFSLFRVGFNLVYFLTLLYLYGLWAVAGRKVYDLPKWKAFAGALVPIIILLIFGVIFDKIGIPKLQSWII